MSKKGNIKGGKKTILIDDEDMLDLINELGALPIYNYNFSKIASHALKFGLATLYEKAILKNDSSKTEGLENENIKSLIKDPKESMIEDYMFEMIALMKEEIINSSIVKSIVSSLFNRKVAELGEIPKEMLEDGMYRKTPSYLEGYERRAYKNIRGGE